MEQAAGAAAEVVVASRAAMVVKAARKVIRVVRTAEAVVTEKAPTERNRHHLHPPVTVAVQIAKGAKERERKHESLRG